VRVASLVNFEMFRPALEEVLVKKNCKTRRDTRRWMSFSSYVDC